MINKFAMPLFATCLSATAMACEDDPNDLDHLKKEAEDADSSTAVAGEGGTGNGMPAINAMSADPAAAAAATSRDAGAGN